MVNRPLSPMLLLLLPVAIYDIVLIFVHASFLPLLDPLAHALLGMVLAIPYYQRSRNWLWFLLAAFLSTTIDIDHAIMAGSFDVQAMTMLPSRPPTHSITFAVVLVLMVLPLSRPIAYFTFIMLAGHCLRDLSSGTVQLLYPLDWQPFAPFLYWATLPALWWLSGKGAKQIVK